MTYIFRNVSKNIKNLLNSDAPTYEELPKGAILNIIIIREDDPDTM